MMVLFERLRPRGITAQITGIVAASTILGMVLTILIVIFLSDQTPTNDAPPAVASRIADVTRIIRAANDPAEADRMLATIRKAGIGVDKIALSELVAPPPNPGLSPKRWASFRILEAEPDIDVLKQSFSSAGPAQQMVVKLDADHALVFDTLASDDLWRLILTPTALVLAIVLIFVLLLSLYAVRWIIAPLAGLANAALSFGHSPRDDQVISRRGPREIAQVADALNDMRTRIRALLEDRTRMLAAISHDLRTPLTRLRLRVERVGDDALRNKMLGDIGTVSHMLDETLDYLREDGRSEAISRVDLPSILQTICWDFVDMGHAVAYDGPARMAWTVRPRSLTRALTNVVENGVKHGGAVTVALRTMPHGGIEIEISDDGPGIPAPLRSRVFEPFFKADSARNGKNSGFGLGLSITQDIVKRHGGEIRLRAAEPGLAVHILLPTDIPAHAA
jgi:signal transduction histidine kinase